MAPHSDTLVWKIPWTEEPGKLQSMGSNRVGHNWATSLSLFTFMHWRRKWQPTRVLAWRIPGTGEPGGLLSMGSHRVRHDWSDLAAAEFDTLLFCQVTDWCQRRHFLKIKFTCACCSHRIKIAIPMHVFFIWCHRFMGNLNLCYSFGIRFNSMPALCIYF